MSSLSFIEIIPVWERNGGDPAFAPIAACIALAESGGDPNAENGNPNASIDRGLWQINSVHGELSTFDLDLNAKAAITISGNGVNWRPWCTAYSDGACGTKGGTFDPTGNSPAGRYYLQYVHPAPISPGGKEDEIPLMAYGESSPPVKALQVWLNAEFREYSHIWITPSVNGYYGDQTAGVVAEFQRRTGITGNGRNFGPQTRHQAYNLGFRYGG